MKFLSANMLSFACLAIMFAIGVFLYPSLPDTLPTQYGIDGVGRIQLPKLDVILLLPIVYAATITAINVMIHFSPGKFSMPNSKRAMDIESSASACCCSPLTSVSCVAPKTRNFFSNTSPSESRFSC